MTWQIYTKEIKLPYKKRIIIHIFPIKIKLYYNKIREFGIIKYL